MRRLLVLLLAAFACGKHHVTERRTDDPPATGTAPAPAPSTPPTVPPVMGVEPAGATGATTAATTLPPGYADLAKATRIEIKDEWNGLGETHDLVAVLERGAGERSFKVDAKVARAPGSLRESIHDSTDVASVDHGRSRADFKSKRGTVDAPIVEAFLAEVAARKIDPKQDYPTGRLWTDDYPRGHVIVWVPNADPIHLAFRDQQRHWRVNGAFITVDAEPLPKDPLDAAASMHKRINERYRAMLKAIGLEAWTKEVNARNGRRGR